MSSATDADLALLVDLRDGVVHAAADETVEERLLVAFIQQVDASLADMGRARVDFWRNRLAVVDALLAQVTDKVAHRVSVKLAAAAAFEKRYGHMPQEVRDLVRQLQPTFDEATEAPHVWPCLWLAGYR